MIEFDRIAIPFSKQASNCTNFLYSVYVYSVRFWVQLSAFNGIFSDVSVTYLLIPFTIRTHETVWSLNKDSIMILVQTSFVKIDFRIQDSADFRIRTNPPFLSGCFQISRLCVFSTCCLHNLRSLFICNEELSFPQLPLRNQRRSTASTISDHQEVLRISVRILAPSHHVPMMFNSEMWRSHWESQSVSPKIHNISPSV